jgi:uncharacterized protein
MKIGLLSDTHGFLDPKLMELFSTCDELWHAGDIGTVEVLEALEATGKPVRAVYGNIDGQDIRIRTKENLFFEVDGLQVAMTHIAGSPGRYPARVKEWLRDKHPGMFICGHSHIVKVSRDPKQGFLHVNPGAAGIYGFHIDRTAIRFDIEDGQVRNMELINLGKRGKTGL